MQLARGFGMPIITTAVSAYGDHPNEAIFNMLIDEIVSKTRAQNKYSSIGDLSLEVTSWHYLASVVCGGSLV
jgi:hypothetical protein